MAETKQDAPESVVEAASAETVPAPEVVGKSHSITTSVFAPAGGVPKASVLQSAIQSVRDAIPVVYELNAEIVGAKAATVDKVKGTSFEVEVTYTPRETTGKADPVDVDKVIRGLEVPRSLDGLSEHPGDADFLKGA